MASERVIYSTIGQRVRELRQELKMTQDELGKTFAQDMEQAYSIFTKPYKPKDGA